MQSLIYATICLNNWSINETSDVHLLLRHSTRSGDVMANGEFQYSEKYYDDVYEYRWVIACLLRT